MVTNSNRCSWMLFNCILIWSEFSYDFVILFNYSQKEIRKKGINGYILRKPFSCVRFCCWLRVCCVCGVVWCGVSIVPIYLFFFTFRSVSDFTFFFFEKQILRCLFPFYSFYWFCVVCFHFTDFALFVPIPYILFVKHYDLFL